MILGAISGDLDAIYASCGNGRVLSSAILASGVSDGNESFGNGIETLGRMKLIA